jgi:hypothetical protein
MNNAGSSPVVEFFEYRNEVCKYLSSSIPYPLQNSQKMDYGFDTLTFGCHLILIQLKLSIDSSPRLASIMARKIYRS